jgi:hypothetical protein
MTTGPDRRYDLHDTILDSASGYVRCNADGAILVQDLFLFVSALSEHEGRSTFRVQDSKTGKAYELKEII